MRRLTTNVDEFSVAMIHLLFRGNKKSRESCEMFFSRQVSSELMIMKRFMEKTLTTLAIYPKKIVVQPVAVSEGLDPA